MDGLLPPSYEAATSRDPLPLVAPHVRSRDLPTAALVCRRWHAVFAAELWRDPALHFPMAIGDVEDTQYGTYNSNLIMRALGC